MRISLCTVLEWGMRFSTYSLQGVLGHSVAALLLAPNDNVFIREHNEYTFVF